LAHADENADGAKQAAVVVAVPIPKKPTAFPATTVATSDSDSLGSDLSDEDWDGLDSFNSTSSYDPDDPEVFSSMTPAERAENEHFGAEYSGPILPDKMSAKLLALMGHASTCPCK
jgi:hypothetical protein